MSEKTVPVLRFKGFSGDWERRKLGEQVVFYSGLTYSPANITNGVGTLVLRSSNVKNGEVISADNVYVSSEVVNSDNVLLGDIIVVVRNGSRSLIGKHAQIKKEMKNTVIGAFMTGVRYKHATFLNILLSTYQFDNEIAKNMGATINQITTGVFREMNFFFPTDTTEQTRIGDFFRSLDALISLRQQKHDKLVTVKKAMLSKMFPKDGETVPEVRFAGFSGDWERKRYDETFVSISNNTLSRADLNYNSGLAKNIHYGDVLIKFGELLDAKKEEIPFITDDSLANKFGTSKLQNGDVIIADAAEDETVGKCTELVNIKNETIVSGLHTIPVRPVQFFASGYLGYYMNSPAYHGQLLRLMQGTKVSSISKTALQDTIIVYPNNNDEQTRIGSFFQNLDSLITLQGKELEKLKTIKKSLLDKMFV